MNNYEVWVCLMFFTIMKYRSNFGDDDVAPAKNDKVNTVEKWQKCRIKSKPHAHFQTMDKKMCKVE